MLETNRPPRILVTALTLAAAAALATGAPTRAQKTFPKTSVDYSATQEMEIAGTTTMTGKVWAQPGKTRTEIDAGAGKMTMIVREDLGVGWNLLPGGATYMEIDLGRAGQGGGLPLGAELEVFEKRGSETLDGLATTHYYFESRVGDVAAKGDMWLTDHNIPVRVKMENGFTMTLRDLVVEEQPDSLFELPAGATAVPSPLSN